MKKFFLTILNEIKPIKFGKSNEIKFESHLCSKCILKARYCWLEGKEQKYGCYYHPGLYKDLS